MPDIGDIKSSLLTINHNGWYNLNGQQIDENTRPFAAQNASTIFGGTFLPDLSDAVLSQQTLKTISGTNDVNVLIDNLPNLNLSGATAPFSDVVSTDLNGSGLQPLIGGVTASNIIPVTTGFGGGLNVSLTGTTAPFTDSIVSSGGGAVTTVLSGTTAAYNNTLFSDIWPGETLIADVSSTIDSTITSTTQGIVAISGVTDMLAAVNLSGSTSIVNTNHEHMMYHSPVEGGTTGQGPTSGGWGASDGTLKGGSNNMTTTTENPNAIEHSHTFSTTVPAHSHGVSLDVPAHSHTVTVPGHTHEVLIDTPGHQHQTVLNLPSLSTSTDLTLANHTHTTDINIPSLDVVTPFNMSGHSHSFDLNLPSSTVTGDVNIPNHAHSLDLEIPSLAVSVPLNGLQQPLSVKGKRFGVNFFIYLGIG